MALLTAEFVGKDAVICWADFKDTHALFHPKIGKFVGFNTDGFMMFGTNKIIMKDGLWLIEEDINSIVKYQDVSASELSLALIK